MSSRRQLRRITKADVDYKEDDHSGPSENEAVPTPTKRRKPTGGAQKKVSKRRKGKLSKLPDMPLDVLYEVAFERLRGTKYTEVTWVQIFSRLHPQDLLRISWTTKAFRRVLTSTSSKTVWMNSFTSVEGLPPCPDDMNEVEYANLLFNPLCQVRINNPSALPAPLTFQSVLLQVACASLLDNLL